MLVCFFSSESVSAAPDRIESYTDLGVYIVAE